MSDFITFPLPPLFGVYPAAEEASSPAQSLKNFGVYADLNLNGRTDVGDALLILQYSVGKITPTQDEISAADLDGDGKVTVSDALLDLQYSMGMFFNLCRRRQDRLPHNLPLGLFTVCA